MKEIRTVAAGADGKGQEGSSGRWKWLESGYVAVVKIHCCLKICVLILYKLHYNSFTKLNYIKQFKSSLCHLTFKILRLRLWPVKSLLICSMVVNFWYLNWGINMSVCSAICRLQKLIDVLF